MPKKKKSSINKFRWCETWKSLFLVSTLVTITLAIFHLYAEIQLNYCTPGAQSKLYVTASTCRIGIIAFIVFYIKNYRVLLERKVISDSRVLFCKGLVPLIIIYITTIIVMIFV